MISRSPVTRCSKASASKSSTVFTVGGFRWTVSFFPDGVRVGSFGNASAFLNCVRPEKDARARFTLNLLDKDEVQVTMFEEVEYTFTPECIYRGFPQFVNRSRLRSLSLANNGSFIIRCRFELDEELEVEEGDSLGSMSPLSTDAENGNRKALEEELAKMHVNGDINGRNCGKEEEAILAVQSLIEPDKSARKAAKAAAVAASGIMVASGTAGSTASSSRPSSKPNTPSKQRKPDMLLVSK
ncbi:hypothetical protein ZWY2020_012935 [Hordeum vulgare]|nr:hypothetical protein ZWY2020_012935 [Hordeum vulgare]